MSAMVTLGGRQMPGGNVLYSIVSERWREGEETTARNITITP